MVFQIKAVERNRNPNLINVASTTLSHQKI